MVGAKDCRRLSREGVKLGVTGRESGGRAVATVLLGNVVPPAVGLVSGPILAQVLGVSGRGDLAAGTAPLLFGMSALTLGLPEAITVYVARAGRRSSRRLLLRTLPALAAAGVLGWIGVVLCSDFLSGGDLSLKRMIVGTTSVLPVCLVLAGIRGVGLGRESWRSITYERSGAAGLRLAALLVLAGLGLLNARSAAGVFALTACVGIVFYWPLFLKRPRSGSVECSGIARVGASLWMGSLAGILVSRLDQLLIVPLSSSYELGLYAVAVPIAEVSPVVVNAVSEVLLAKQSANRRPDAAAYAMRMSLLVSLLSSAILGVASVLLVGPLFGVRFLPSVPVVLVLLLAAVVNVPFIIGGVALVGNGAPLERSVSSIIGLVVNVALVMCLVPPMGARGAAIATLCACASQSAAVLGFVRSRLHCSLGSQLIPRWQEVRDLLRRCFGLLG